MSGLQLHLCGDVTVSRDDLTRLQEIQMDDTIQSKRIEHNKLPVNSYTS